MFAMSEKIRARIGGEEIREPAPFDGVLPSANEILGVSDLLDPTTYRRLREGGYVQMRGRREAELDDALRIAGRLAPETAGQIRVDLIAPALVNDLGQVNADSEQVGAVLRAIGDHTTNLPESQQLHRGYFGLPSPVAQAAVSALIGRPEYIPEMLSSFDGERTLSVDDETARAVAERVRNASSAEEVLARIAVARAEYSTVDYKGHLGDPCNSTDARTFRYAALTEQLVDPAYYESAMYQKVFPRFEDWQDVYNNIRHMLVGFDGPAGNDHMFVYANKPDRPNSVASALGDYSQCRSGNYLFHDLAIMAARAKNSVEAGDAWVAQAPFETVLDYAVANYLGGMMVDKERLHETHHVGVTDGVAFLMGNTAFNFPLKKIDRIIPARILSKGGGEQRLYGPDDYLAELVDMAMKIDEVHEISGRNTLLEGNMLERLYAQARIWRPEAEPRLRQIALEAQADGVKPLHISYERF